MAISEDGRPHVEYFSAEEQVAADTQRLRDMIAAHEGLGVGVLRDAFTDHSDARGLRDRFDLAFSRLQVSELAIQTANGVWLTQRGRWLLEQENKSPVVAEPKFSDLRQAYVDSLPERRRALVEQARAIHVKRSERQREQERVLGGFVSYVALARLPGWRIGPERDLHADNVLALYPPRFDDLGDSSDVYVRLAADEEKHVCWVRSSRGGPVVAIGEGWPPEAVRAAILQVWVPVVDMTAPRLPELADVQEDRHV